MCGFSSDASLVIETSGKDSELIPAALGVVYVLT